VAAATAACGIGAATAAPGAAIDPGTGGVAVVTLTAERAAAILRAADGKAGGTVSGLRQLQATCDCAPVVAVDGNGPGTGPGTGTTGAALLNASAAADVQYGLTPANVVYLGPLSDMCDAPLRDPHNVPVSGVVVAFTPPAGASGPVPTGGGYVPGEDELQWDAAAAAEDPEAGVALAQLFTDFDAATGSLAVRAKWPAKRRTHGRVA
jgi:hypothetical protein